MDISFPFIETSYIDALRVIPLELAFLLGLSACFIGLPSLAGFLFVGFALSFSSTVLAVKALEDGGDMGSLHGRIAISILIVQDLIAVVLIAIAAGMVPSLWALLLLLLIPLRPVLLKILDKAEHAWSNIPVLVKGQRIAIPLNTTVDSTGTLHIILKDDERIEVLRQGVEIAILVAKLFFPTFGTTPSFLTRRRKRTWQAWHHPKTVATKCFFLIT